MPRTNRRRSSSAGHNLAQQVIAMDKLDRKITETKDKYNATMKAAWIMKALQTFIALLVPIVAFIPNSNIVYVTALLGAIVASLNGVDVKKKYAKDAGKYKLQYDLLVKERHEYIKRQGPYSDMQYSMRVRQVSWRTDNFTVRAGDETGMLTPASSLDDDLTQLDSEKPRIRQV